MINFVRRSSNKTNSNNNNGSTSETNVTNCSNNSSTSTANCTTDTTNTSRSSSLSHCNSTSVSSKDKSSVQAMSMSQQRLNDSDPEVRLEEKLRRKAFAHYDVQSITASLVSACKSSNLIIHSKRRNTTTGASAASFVPTKSSSGGNGSSSLSKEGSKESEDGSNSLTDDVIIIDDGDGRSNELVQSCPFFRNELGGEEERIICLNRLTSGQVGGGQSIYSTSSALIGSSNGSCPGNNYRSNSLKSTATSNSSSDVHNDVPPLLHKPSMATGLSLLEAANDRRWKIKSCPYQSNHKLEPSSVTEVDRYNHYNSSSTLDTSSFVFEHVDVGSRYYREHFHGLEHQNWFGLDDNLGPIAISIRKERVPSMIKQSTINDPMISSSSDKNNHFNHRTGSLSNGSSMSKPTESRLDSRSDSKCSNDNKETTTSTTTVIKHQYRLIIRTSDLNVLRGIVYEDVIPGLSSLSSSSSSKHNSMSNHHAKEVIEYITPEVTSSCLRLGTASSDEQVIKLDEQSLNKTYKVGVLYCKYGQGSEEEMYNNEYSSRAFDDFLLMLGEKVRLKGFTKYKAGLDNKTDTTGTHCIYSQFQDNEITFHVSTLLPFTPNNRQQLLRKRHVGNDIVTIIFQEPGAKPFTPKTIRSHFQHVFIVVRLLTDSTTELNNDDKSGQQPFHYDPSNVRYQVAVTRSKEVPVFGPPITINGIYSKSCEFTEFILTKIINAENAAHRSDKFKSMAQRTRHEYLKDLSENYSTSTTLSDVSSGPSAGAKLVSTLLFGAGRSKRSNRGTFRGDSVIQGAIVWDLLVEDYGQSKPVDCQLGISFDTFVIVDEVCKEVIFACPTFSILGWSSHPSYIKIYFHQGEVVFLRCKDPDLDEIAEIVTRLKAVTGGCESQELILRRNSLGQLGFHFIQEGIVTDVEPYAFAWQSGLRPNFRIVEICTVAIAKLDHDGIKDLLKTSMIVSVTVLPPKVDGSPRRGCPLPQCPYLTTLANGSTSSTSSRDRCEYENISGIFERTTLLGSDRRRKGQHRTIVHTKGHAADTSGNFSGQSKSQPVSPDHHHVNQINHHQRVDHRNSDGQQQQHQQRIVTLTRTESHHRQPPQQQVPSTSSSPLNSWQSNEQQVMFDPRTNGPRIGSAFQPVQSRHEQQQQQQFNNNQRQVGPIHNFPIHRSSDLKFNHSVNQSNLTTWHSELSLSSKTMTSGNGSNSSLSKEDGYPFNKYGHHGHHNNYNYNQGNNQQQQSVNPVMSNNQSKSQLVMNTTTTPTVIGLNGRPFLDSLVRDTHYQGSPFVLNNNSSSGSSFREHSSAASTRPAPGGNYIPLNPSSSQFIGTVGGQTQSWTTPLPKSVVRRNGAGQSMVPGHPSLSQSSSLGYNQQQQHPSFATSGQQASFGGRSTIERTSFDTRTKSPRFTNYNNPGGFRPLTSSASYKSRVKSGSNKSSDSGSSSTLQEDLLRLINPEYIGTAASGSPTKSNRTSPSKVEQRPELSPPKDVRVTQQQQQLFPGPRVLKTTTGGDIVTTAQAIVTSNSSEPSTPVETSPDGKTLSTTRLPVLMEGSDAEWNTLVTTATKAMASLPSGLAPTSKRVGHDDDSDVDTKSIGSGEPESPDLDESLSWLEEFSTSGKKSPERSPGRSSESTGQRSLDGHGRTPDSSGRSVDGVIDTVSRVRSPPDARHGRSKSPGNVDNKLLSLSPPSESSGRSNSALSSAAASSTTHHPLEHAVEQLQKTNASLEEEVNKLREENQRLQEESQTATAQLRKFSEWFFQNINAK